MTATLQPTPLETAPVTMLAPAPPDPPPAPAVPPGAQGRATRVITVLFLVDQLTELGGGERILLKLAQLLPPQGFRVIVVSFRGQPNRSLSALPIDIRFLPLQRTWGPAAVRAAWQLRSLIRREAVDVVHTFFETADTFGAVVARIAGVRAILSSRRDMGILRKAKHRLLYRLLRPLYRRVLTVSAQVRDSVIQADGVAPGRVLTIYNGVDPVPHGLTSIRPRLQLPGGVPLVTTVANLQRWKGVDVFLRAASLIHQLRPQVHFVIAGEWSDPVLASELFTLRDALGLAACVHFTGQIDEVPVLLQQSAVFCLLSASEGLPNVVLEAMAAGTAVVATAVGGTPEAVADGETGWLVPRGDHERAAQRVVALLDDADQRQTMVNAGQRRVRALFSLTAMVDRHVAIYRELCPARQQAVP